MSKSLVRGLYSSGLAVLLFASILTQDCDTGVTVAFWMRNLCVLCSEFRGCSSETESVSERLVRPIKLCANHLGF